MAERNGRQRSRIRRLELANYRRFERLVVEPLGTVNLIVGANNAGKTTFLEAIEAVASPDPLAILRALQRRGEKVLSGPEDTEAAIGTDLDIAHLFVGHNLGDPETSLHISAYGEHHEFLSCRPVEVATLDDDVAYQRRLEFARRSEFSGPLAFAIEKSGQPPLVVPLSVFGGVNAYDARRRYSRYAADRSDESTGQVRFLGTDEANPRLLNYLWDQVVLTPEEMEVVKALRIIEPSLEKLAFIGDSRRAASSVILKFIGDGPRVPLGSVGDGMKRLLALILHLIPGRDGVVLVDEIDTGLHYSVMESMWRVIIRTALRLNIQVFATTHSQDCVNALAWVLEQEDSWGDDDVRLHRLEKDVPSSIPFSPHEIITAARKHIEIR